MQQILQTCQWELSVDSADRQDEVSAEKGAETTALGAGTAEQSAETAAEWSVDVATEQSSHWNLHRGTACPAAD